MLRRFFSAAETASESSPDVLPSVDKLLKLATFSERSSYVLQLLCSTLAGDVRGYVVRGNAPDNYQFEAVQGYPPELLEHIPTNGPWRDPRPRIISNIIAELFTPNSAATRTFLGDIGIREAKSSLMVPLAVQEAIYGTLILHQHDGEPFDEDDLKLAKRWGAILGSVQLTQQELSQTRRSLIEFTRAFVEAIEAQDFTQLGHASRVTAYALAIGRTLGFTRGQLSDLYFGAMLHDVGKIGSGMALSVEDHNHPQRGANLVGSSPLLQTATEGIRSHHENWDGSGFPLGLKRDEIPLSGRIIAVADAFDLLSSERGQALPIHEVEKGLELRRGRELDPELVNVFINILRQGKSTAELAKLDESDLPF
jgi:HD-GYP domain-containing protein (c-di-GMP phosphodiesterase class II)